MVAEVDEGQIRRMLQFIPATPKRPPAFVVTLVKPGSYGKRCTFVKKTISWTDVEHDDRLPGIADPADPNEKQGPWYVDHFVVAPPDNLLMPAGGQLR